MPFDRQDGHLLAPDGALELPLRAVRVRRIEQDEVKTGRKPRPSGFAAFVSSLLVAALASAMSACDQPVESLKEWTPAVHHSNDDSKLGQLPSGGQTANAAAAKGGGGDVAQLVDIAWRQQCSSCHGATGHGDGQTGPMVQAPDLTREDWQSKVTDAEMAATIKNGKNRMPKFDLPDSVLRGLVARVRSLRAR